MSKLWVGNEKGVVSAVLSGKEKVSNEPMLDCWRSTDFTRVLPKDCVQADMVVIEMESCKRFTSYSKLWYNPTNSKGEKVL